MSFSSDVKKEICSVEQFDREALKAELYGMLLFSRNFSPNKITFTTESNYAGNRLIFLLQNLYMPIIEKQSALRTKSSDSHLYKIIVVDGNDCKRIFEDFGHTDGQITLRVNRANLSSEELSQSFLRGVFLSCGSVSDPMKSYHLEFGTKSRSEADFLIHILTGEGFSPKITERKGKYVVYIKECEQIADILGYIGAGYGTLEMFTIQVEKQLKNDINEW